MSISDVLVDTQRFYRGKVHDSWVHSYLDSRYLASRIRPAAIGYAPDSWNALTDFLTGIGHSEEALIAAGVARRSTKTGNLYDIMRDRMMIPITDQNGVIVGFTGRANPDPKDPDTPKYVNTPATEVYHKGELLYGITNPQTTVSEPESNPASSPIDRLRNGGVAVILEGPLDKLALDRANEINHRNYVALATCGTALTNAHLKLLDTYNPTQVIFCFDGDLAGQNAQTKAWKLTEPYPHWDIRSAVLKPGDDPASIHPKALIQALDDAQQSLMTLTIQQLEALNSAHPANVFAAIEFTKQIIQEQGHRVTEDQKVEWLRLLVTHTHLSAETVAQIYFDNLNIKDPIKALTTPSSATTKHQLPSQTPKLDRYTTAALQGEVDAVTNAQPGERNQTLNKSAYNLGTLIGAGQLERTEVEDQLHQAALAIGLSPTEAASTIRSGINRGITKPRKIPDTTTSSSTYNSRKEGPQR